MTTISPDLISSYLETIYWVCDNDREFGLKIGTHSPELIALFNRHRTATATFITAYNPFSRPTDTDENDRAQGALKADLERLSIVVLDGRGEGTVGTWPPEPSFLAIGLTLEQALALGWKYGQNAIVWIGEDGKPTLTVIDYNALKS
jgi:hypothetical protein